MRTITNCQMGSIIAEYEAWKKTLQLEITPEQEKSLKMAFLSGALVGARMVTQVSQVGSHAMIEHVTTSLKGYAQSIMGGGGGSVPPGPTIVDPDKMPPAPGGN